MTLKNLFALCFFALSCLAAGQTASKKLPGKWVCCEKTESLNKFDTLTFVKADPGAVSACVEKNCKYSEWTFENKDGAMKLVTNMNTGCKDATSSSTASWEGTWAADKKNVLTIFDDKYTKHLFAITSLGNTVLKLKRIK